MGQFRRDDAHDPVMFAAALAVVFSEYPKDVVIYATDPRTGLPTKGKWAPEIYEVREFLEACMIPRREKEARDKRIANQFAERDRWEAEQKPSDEPRWFVGCGRPHPYRVFLDMVAAGKAKEPVLSREEAARLDSRTEYRRREREEYKSGLPAKKTAALDMDELPPLEAYSDMLSAVDEGEDFENLNLAFSA